MYCGTVQLYKVQLLSGSKSASLLHVLVTRPPESVRLHVPC